MVGAVTGGVDETLLDSWIKELESGIQGMSDLMGIDPMPTPPLTPKQVNLSYIAVSVCI